MQNRHISTLALDYLSHIKAVKYFSSLPQWKKQLFSYEARNHKPPITLPPSDAETAHKILASLPKANYWALSFNLDTFDDFIEEIS